MVQEEAKVQTRRRQADTAIQLALANRWKEAVTVNQSILEEFPNDGDSYNRLGKALMELGRNSDAKKAYTKCLELDPTNSIARKNLERLKVRTKSKAAQADSSRADPKLFIEEMGKSAITVLSNVPAKLLAKLNAGDRVELQPKEQTLTVVSKNGDVIGSVEPKLTSRMLRLLEAGNQYTAAVTGISDGDCRIIIKETFQHPNQAGRPSFPTAITAGKLRPYTKGSLLRARAEESDRVESSDSDDEDGDGNEWDSERVAQEGHVRLNDAAAAEDMDDEDIEE